MSDISRAASVRRNLALGALVAGPIAVTIGSLVQIDTGKTGLQEITRVAAHRGRFYGSGLLFALGLALVAVGLSQVYRLVERKGGVWATVGGAMMQIGAMSAAAALYMFTAAIYLASDHRLNPAVMGQFDKLGEKSAAVGWAFFGFIAFALGGLILGVGLLRARTVPIWQPILLMLGVVITFFVDTSNNLVSAVAGLPLVIGLVSLAWSVSRLPAAPPPAVDLTEREVPFPRTAAETAPAEQPSTN